MNRKEMLAMLSSYGRTFLASSLTVYATGDMNAKDLLLAGLASIVGPGIRALNPNDPAFGRVATVIETELVEKVAKKTKKKA